MAIMAIIDPALINPFLIIGTIILIYPAYISIKNFRVTGSKDYLIIVSLLISLLINTLIAVELSVNYPSTTVVRFIVGTTYELVLILFTLHAFRLKSGKTLGYKILGLFFVINYLIFLSINLTWKIDVEVFNNLSVLFGNLSPLLQLIFCTPIHPELLRLLTGLFIIYVYSTIKPVAKCRARTHAGQVLKLSREVLSPRITML
jgi:hypothetical protein